MLPDRVSNPGPLIYESGALPIALRGPAMNTVTGHPIVIIQICFKDLNLYICKQCGVLGFFLALFLVILFSNPGCRSNFLTFNPHLL